MVPHFMHSGTLVCMHCLLTRSPRCLTCFSTAPYTHLESYYVAKLLSGVTPSCLFSQALVGLYQVSLLVLMFIMGGLCPVYFCQHSLLTGQDQHCQHCVSLAHDIPCHDQGQCGAAQQRLWHGKILQLLVPRVRDRSGGCEQAVISTCNLLLPCLATVCTCALLEVIQSVSSLKVT